MITRPGLDDRRPAQPSRSPWHAGEVALQASLGMAGRMAEIGPHVLRDHLIEQHRLFYPQLPVLILGAVDPVILLAALAIVTASALRTAPKATLQPHPYLRPPLRGPPLSLN